MNEQEARQFIVDNVLVTRQMVTTAKKLVMENYDERTRMLLDALLREVNAVMPERVVLDDEVDSIPALRQAARSISWRLAISEAIWQLVHASILIPTSNPNTDTAILERTRRGHSGGWRFNEFTYSIPGPTLLAFSQRSGIEQTLVDGDLYIDTLEISGLHDVVEISLREAVACFRNELYDPALAMLTKAFEAAWIRLGTALLDFLPSAAAENLERDLQDPRNSLYYVSRQILEKYRSHKTDLQRIYDDSGVSPNMLEDILVWTDTVRNARNAAVHPEAQTVMPNSYEKVAALLIGATTHLEAIYLIINAANSLS